MWNKASQRFFLKKHACRTGGSKRARSKIAFKLQTTFTTKKGSARIRDRSRKASHECEDAGKCEQAAGRFSQRANAVSIASAPSVLVSCRSIGIGAHRPKHGSGNCTKATVIMTHLPIYSNRLMLGFLRGSLSLVLNAWIFGTEGLEDLARQSPYSPCILKSSIMIVNAKLSGQPHPAHTHT